MPFPLTIGGVSVGAPADLAALVRDEAHTPSVVADRRPSVWVLELVSEGALERELAVGLSAALLQHEDAGTVSEGARLAVGLAEPALGKLMLQALDGHDVGLLLMPDPADPLTSVEDTLLRAVGEVLVVDEPGPRSALLTRLRNAGLPDVELAVLCRWGSAVDMERWLPAVLSEEVGDEGRAHIAERLTAADDGARAMREVLQQARPELLLEDPSAP